jgi:hypothetical protein
MLPTGSYLVWGRASLVATGRADVSVACKISGLGGASMSYLQLRPRLGRLTVSLVAIERLSVGGRVELDCGVRSQRRHVTASHVSLTALKVATLTIQ